ncbi:MAG: hypothetical protein KIS92_08020 [Planctomycetota bacterium]|nr:hypothetical protein [Planctomycetota bacterium]
MKKPGHVLICPWCRKKYKLVEGDRIEEWTSGSEPPPPLPESKPPKEGDPAPAKPRKHTTLIVKKRNVTSVSSKVVAAAKPSAEEKPEAAKARPAAAAPTNGESAGKPERDPAGKSDLVLKRSQSSVFTKSKLALLRKAAEAGASDDGKDEDDGGAAEDGGDSAKESGATEAIEMPDEDASESGSLESGETGAIEEPGEPRKKKKKKKKKKKRAKSSAGESDGEPPEKGSTEKLDFDELGEELAAEGDDPAQAQVDIPALTGESLYSLEGDSVEAKSRENRPTERLQAVSTRSVAKVVSRRARPSTPLDVDFIDEPQPPPPLTLEKLVVYMFIAAVPLGALAFAVYMWWGIQEGVYQFQDRVIFGIVIKGNNPWVWVGGILLGALSFLLAWVVYMYLFVYRGKRAEGEKAEKKPGEAARPKRARKSAESE